MLSPMAITSFIACHVLFVQDAIQLIGFFKSHFEFVHCNGLCMLAHLICASVHRCDTILHNKVLLLCAGLLACEPAMWTPL